MKNFQRLVPLARSEEIKVSGCNGQSHLQKIRGNISIGDNGASGEWICESGHFNRCTTQSRYKGDSNGKTQIGDYN
jgi:hypothetical protein